MFFCWRAILDGGWSRLGVKGGAIERERGCGFREYTRGQIFRGKEIRLMDDTTARKMESTYFVHCPSPFRGLAFSIPVRTDRIGRAFSPLGSLSGVNFRTKLLTYAPLPPYIYCPQ